MSMLSGQADKLRKEAQNMRDFGRYEMEQMLLDAADTILQLRDDLQRVNAENAKLRSLSAEVAGILFNLEVDRCVLCDRDSINHPCPVHTVKGGECLIKSELCELGVEVD